MYGTINMHRERLDKNVLFHVAEIVSKYYVSFMGHLNLNLYVIITIEQVFFFRTFVQ